MIYFDHNATTDIYPEVSALFTEISGKPFNPSSVHTIGREGRKIVENSKEKILDSLTDKPSLYNLIFASGGTEANNLIISNFADADIFISAAEHSSIFEHSKYRPNVKIIDINKYGLLNLDRLKASLKKSEAKKKLVSVALAGNETGILQDLAEISKIAHESGAYCHSDIVQAIGKIKVDLEKSGIDFATISGHKFGAPVGIGALAARKDFALNPLLIGGGQQGGIRSGTESVALIASLGLASEIAMKKLVQNNTKTLNLREYLEESLLKIFPKTNIIGRASPRLPNTSLVTRPGKDAEVTIVALDLQGFCLSSGSACSSGKVGRPRIIEAMGIAPEEARSAVRISLSCNNDKEEIDAFIKSWRNL